MTAKKIQRVELNKFYYAPIYCPFCGNETFPGDDYGTFQLNPCKHLQRSASCTIFYTAI